MPRIPAPGSPSNAPTPDVGRLASILLHGLGIDYGSRLNGLDDLRRYYTLLKDALVWDPKPVTCGDLFDRVWDILRNQGYRMGEEVLNALGVVAEISPEQPIGELCDGIGEVANRGRRVRMAAGVTPQDIEDEMDRIDALIGQMVQRGYPERTISEARFQESVFHATCSRLLQLDGFELSRVVLHKGSLWRVYRQQAEQLTFQLERQV